MASRVRSTSWATVVLMVTILKQAQNSHDRHVSCMHASRAAEAQALFMAPCPRVRARLRPPPGLGACRSVVQTKHRHIKAAKPCRRPRPAPLLRLWVVPESSGTKASPIRLHHRHRGCRRHLHEGVHVCDISIYSLHAKAVLVLPPRLHGRGRWIRGPPRLLPSILTGMHALLHVYHDTDDGDPVLPARGCLALLLDRKRDKDFTHMLIISIIFFSSISFTSCVIKFSSRTCVLKKTR